MSKTYKEKLVERVIKLYFSGKLDAKYSIEKGRSEQEYNIQAVRYSHGSGSKTNNVSNKVEQFMVSRDLCAQYASFLKLLIDEIESAVDTLIVKNIDENGKEEVLKEDYNILKWTYQRNPLYTDSDIAAKLNISIWTVGKKRKSLIKEMTRLINVSYYLDNPIEEIAIFFSNLIDV